ncbi:hypothetical protein KSP40_PGU004740 [Platanthera guangdongensis]|uniref:Uncharacterized protein n=1 Tax=Platanthera guangdongensis TaxID=2320717 RepID=A0ABR2MRL1_9ASPA
MLVITLGSRSFLFQHLLCNLSFLDDVAFFVTELQDDTISDAIIKPPHTLEDIAFLCDGGDGGKNSIPTATAVLEAALGTWFFSVAGALIAIPVGIRKKSLGPLVFFGTTGTMLDIIIGVSQCEREFAERQIRLMEEKNPCNPSVDAPEVHS